jgi:hypothetical protein
MIEKEVFQHLAEYANSRISIGQMLKWPNWPNPEQVDLHSRVIWPISPCNRLAKKGLQGNVENFCSFHEKSRVLYEFELFLIFLEIMAEFAVFSLLSHPAICLFDRIYFGLFFFGHLNLGL